MKAINSMLCWNPNSSDVKVFVWPDTYRLSRGYRRSCLSCNFSFHKMNFEQRKAIIFIEAMHLIIRDKVDPISVHKALLSIDEYRDGCSSDMPFLDNFEYDV